MCKSQFLKYFLEESCKSCSSIQKAYNCVEFDECSSSSFEYFKAGYSAHQKEVEPKIEQLERISKSEYDRGISDGKIIAEHGTTMWQD